MSETKEYILIIIVAALIIGAIVVCNGLTMDKIKSMACSSTNYTNITNVYQYNSKGNEIVYNYTTYIPVRTFQFSPRVQRYCTDGRKYVVDGQSMFPLTPSNGIVHVEPVKFNDLQIGDVIDFVKDGKEYFHAIIYINNEYALTAGYNNNEMDSWKVYASDVKQRYCDVK